MSWGPSHQQTPRRWSRRARRAPFIAWFLAVLIFNGHHTIEDWLVTGAFLALLIWLGIVIRRRWRRSPGRGLPGLGWLARRRNGNPQRAGQPQVPGVHLGLTREGLARRTLAERAVLVLGPPRSGKTSSIIIPTLLSYPGPVVSTSTKPDVMHATHTTRERSGRVWQFDPTGTSPPVDGMETLRWSPVLAATEWDGALLMARAMVTGAGVGAGTTDQSHWTRRAQALLAPLLHAAAVSGRGVDDLVDWVARHEIDEPGALLSEHDGAKLAVGQLVGLANTEARERSSIFSTAADALDAYTSQAALNAATRPNFFAGRFVTSQDTIYIHAPAEHQQLAAPLVCGLLAEIRRATYAHHRDHTLTQPVLFALDEVANIAPIAELPQIASEGGGQGLLLLAALQDLSQARARWGAAADGFLTLFATKLILRGIADHKTLETVSVTLGEYDRRVISYNNPNRGWLDRFGPASAPRPHATTTTSTQRQRRVGPGDVAAIPPGKVLHLHGVAYELLTLTPAHLVEPWRSLTTPTQPQ